MYYDRSTKYALPAHDICWLLNFSQIVYEPKTKYHATDKRPPRISSSFFGWIPPLLRHHEPELLSKIGLDAVAFLKFLHLLRWIFTLTALVGCGALIPIDLLYTLSVKPPQFDILSAMSIQFVQGGRLYAHIAATYLFTVFLMILVYSHWRSMYQLRNEWFRSPEYQHLFYARTLCITNIPPKLQSDAGLWKIFDALQLPYQVTSVHIGRRAGALPGLIAEHDSAVLGLEQVLAEYEEADKLTSERPILVLGGFWGIGGRSVDAVEYYTYDNPSLLLFHLC